MFASSTPAQSGVANSYNGVPIQSYSPYTYQIPEQQYAPPQPKATSPYTYQIPGFAQGGMATTGGGVGGASDYIVAALRNREIVAPERDFRDWSREMMYDNYRNRNWFGGGEAGSQQNVFQFGNVYGVDDLERVIEGSIKRANKQIGFSNATYTIDTF